MNPLSILLLGMAMSTDAFAAAIGKGIAMGRPGLAQALRAALVFGVIEAATPLIGWLLGRAAAQFMAQWDHWIAFALLTALGLHMIRNGWRTGDVDAAPAGSSLAALALAGLATSIDAMAAGAGLAFVDVSILLVAAVIGTCTFAMVTAGVLLGRTLGAAVGRRAEIAGGVVLIAVGTAILLHHGRA